MTSESSQGGPPGNRPPRSRGASRHDQGDLWSDDAAGTSGQPDAVPPSADRPGPKTPSGPSSPASSGARPQPQQRQIVPEAPAAEVFEDYDEDDDEDYDDVEPSTFGNPYLLAGLAIGGAVFLAIIVVFLFGRGGDDTNPLAVTGGGTTSTPATTASATADGLGLAARSIAIATIREGPALSHLELGSLQANQDVQVVGRNEEATWFLIVFPPGTQLQGWVPETALRLPDDVAALVDQADFTPVPRPEIPDPTATPVVVQDTPAPNIDETATPGPESGPDVAISITSDCTPGSEITVVINNVGDEALIVEPIQVRVTHDGIVEYQQDFQADIDPGASVALDTGISAQSPSMSASVVLTETGDINPANNIAGCVVEGGGGNVPPPIQN